MVSYIITGPDLPVEIQTNDMAQVWLDGVNATAGRVAPCLIATDPAPTAAQIAEAKLVLIGMVKRWADAGTGAFQQQTAGPFSVMADTRQRTGYRPWPSEIQALQAICKSGASTGAFSIDTAPALSGVHLPWCSLSMGATYCSCGVDIAGVPIYECD